MTTKLRKLPGSAAKFRRGPNGWVEIDLSPMDLARFEDMDAHYDRVCLILDALKNVKLSPNPSPAVTVRTKGGITITLHTDEIGTPLLGGGGLLSDGFEDRYDDALAHAVEKVLRLRLEEGEERRKQKEETRRQKISARKKGQARPSAYAIAFVAADEIIRRNPKMSPAALFLKLQRDLPEGTDLPTERTLRRRYRGK